LREHLKQERGRHRIQPEDRPRRTPASTLSLLKRAANDGAHIGQLCASLHARDGQVAVRRVQGVLGLARKYGAARVDAACAALIELGTIEYGSLRRYLERHAEPPAHLQQVGSLIRQLTLYRDLIHERTK
jgi:hypothetical protein